MFKINIIIDAMGGDNAPDAIIGAVKKACEDLQDTKFTLVGDSEIIKAKLNQQGLNENKINIIDAKQVISNDDDPTTAIRYKKNSSMVLGMDALAKGEGDAFLSAGSTGALITGATLIVKRIKGIRRVALATTIPTQKNPTLLLDIGANADCSPEFLQQFAIMGSIYSAGVLGLENPSVGILNIGTEAKKGNELTRTAYGLLKDSQPNFIGNVEARDILNGVCDVLVTDGFTGNVVLKNIEGLAEFFGKELKNIFLKNFLTKISALGVKDGIKTFKKTFNYKEYGGAPVLGAKKVVVKAHGSSDEKAFYSAILQAKKFVETDIIKKIERKIEILLD